MSWRFRRRVHVAPGLDLNLGKRGASISAGVRGAHVTVGPHRPARFTAGLPDTGLSVTKSVNRAAGHRPRRRRHAHVVFWAVIFLIAGHLLGWL
jgi:hypothetical protein